MPVSKRTRPVAQTRSVVQAATQVGTARWHPWRTLTIIAVFTVVTTTIAWHHEMWRDEVRALNIAAGARSISDLFALLHNEGHPPLWYLLLYAGYRLTHSMLILKPISLACAIGAAYLILRYAPFPTWMSVLFLGGAFPLYQYSVICRNYGISMLLMFAAAAVYKDRWSRPLPFCAVLILLANTNAYSLMIAGALLLAFVGEALVIRPPVERRVFLQGVTGVVVVVAGMITAIVVMMPDATSAVSKIHNRTAHDVLAALRVGVVAAPGSLRGVLTGGNEPLAVALFAAMTVYLLMRPWLLSVWIVTAVGFSTFSSLVYGADPFQLGLLFILVMVLLWIDQDIGDSPRVPAWLIPKRRTIARFREAVLVLVLLPQVYWGLRVAWMDINSEISSSERLGRYIKNSPALRDAIVIAEPDFMVEALPYYVRNRIYLPREGKDLIKVSLTTARKARLSLDEFLDTAKRLKRESGRTVLMVVQPLNPYGPYVVRYPYGFEFDHSVESLDRFQSSAEPLAMFDKAVSDENYVLCQLHQSEARECPRRRSGDRNARLYMSRRTRDRRCCSLFRRW